MSPRHSFLSSLPTGGVTHLAEDLVQETLGRMYAKWGRRWRIENPSGYAQTTLINLFISLRRKRDGRTFRPGPCRWHAEARSRGAHGRDRVHGHVRTGFRRVRLRRTGRARAAGNRTAARVPPGSQPSASAQPRTLPIPRLDPHPRSSVGGSGRRSGRIRAPPDPPVHLVRADCARRVAPNPPASHRYRLGHRRRGARGGAALRLPRRGPSVVRRGTSESHRRDSRMRQAGNAGTRLATSGGPLPLLQSVQGVERLDRDP